MKKSYLTAGHPHISHKGGVGEGGEGSSQMRTIVFQGCVRTQKKLFLDHKTSKRFPFCTKEAITLPFLIVYRKV